MIHAAFTLPLVAEWDLYDLHSKPAEGDRPSVIEVLSQIQARARVLRFNISTQFNPLIMVIQPKYELEELSVQMTDIHMLKKFLASLTEVTVGHSLTKATNTSFDTHTIRTLAIATTHLSHGSEWVTCPNLKVLELTLPSIKSNQMDEVRQWCVQMMEGRRQAGFPLDRCCIWGSRIDQIDGNDPALVLSTSNEGVIMDE